MNKYLKILTLSGAVLGAISPTAINFNKQVNNDLGNIYSDVQKMQNTLPKLSKIDYKLNISPVQDQNVKFISTDDNGVETELSETETINYLSQTLNQVNAEYETLKATLSDAIKQTMDYLDAYKQGETNLTNEQKVAIKEQSNSIKFLAETLENLSEDVICCIDGCEDCDDDFEKTTSKYLSLIDNIETRIQALNNSLSSLQFINSIGMPYFYNGYHFTPRPYNNVNPDTSYNDNSQENNPNTEQGLSDSNESKEVDKAQTNESQAQLDGTTALADISNETASESADTNSDNDDKPTTFGLKSNIDTYAPTHKRNIDTFFNTALLDKGYYGGGMNYGYGYGMPYGAGYGNPYGAGYGGGYGGLNSNMVNRNQLNEQPTNVPASNTNTLATVENNTQPDVQDEVSKPKKIRAKRAKNIDTYTGTTIQSNINTMGESKISKFFKEKFNNLRNKVRSKKQDSNQLPNNLQENNDIEQNNTIDNNTLTDNIDNIDQNVNTEQLDDTTNNVVDNQLDIRHLVDNAQDDLVASEDPQIKARQ